MFFNLLRIVPSGGGYLMDNRVFNIFAVLNSRYPIKKIIVNRVIGLIYELLN
jgi:hypothetical protein